MTRYRVLSDKFTHGKRGSIVELDDTAPGLNVRALVRGRIIEPAPKPVKKATKRKAAD